MKGHTDGIRCLVGTPYNTVWSGSMEGDGSIRIWECEDNQTELSIRVAALTNSTSCDTDDFSIWIYFLIS